MSSDYISRIKEEKIIPVIKIDRIEDTVPLLMALRNGGCNIAEITLRTACGAEAIALAAKTFPDMLVGAGTVINVEQAKKAVANGSKFIVSPGFDEETAKYLQKENILYIAGAVTPTEIMKLLSCGLNIIKFFPSENYGGIRAMKALAGPFPQITFIPTGGIGAENIQEYFKFDKIIACGGSWMVKDSLIKNGEFDTITELMRSALALVR